MDKGGRTDDLLTLAASAVAATGLLQHRLALEQFAGHGAIALQ